MLFEQFDISVVLEKGEKLLGSSGNEFDVEEEALTSGMFFKNTILKNKNTIQLHNFFSFSNNKPKSIFSGMSRSDAIAFQRHALKKRLGLDLISGLDIGVENLLDDDELVSNEKSEPIATKLTEVPSINHLKILILYFIILLLIKLLLML